MLGSFVLVKCVLLIRLGSSWSNVNSKNRENVDCSVFIHDTLSTYCSVAIASKRRPKFNDCTLSAADTDPSSYVSSVANVFRVIHNRRPPFKSNYWWEILKLTYYQRPFLYANRLKTNNCRFLFHSL